MQPLISFIIPTKNVEKHIERCVKSIISQDYPNYEIIVVDFKSTDNTKQLVLNFNTQKVQFHEINESGVYNAMNFGITKSSGDWILFLGADDFLFKNVLSKIFNKAILSDLILGSVENINKSSSTIKTIYKNKFSTALYWRNTIHHQGVFYAKHILSEYNFNIKYNVLADYELNLRLLKKGKSSTQTEVFITKSEASGLSKNFNRALYQEELSLKKGLIPNWAFVTNIILVKLKFWFKG